MSRGIPNVADLSDHRQSLLAAESRYDQRPTMDARAAAVAKRLAKHGAQRLLRAGIGGAARVVYGERPALPPLQPGDSSIQRILVVRVDLLGDTVLTTAAVRALRRGYPDAAIDVLVQPSTAPILEGDRDIRQVHAFDPHAWRRPNALVSGDGWHDLGRFLREVRAERYDLAISISGDIGAIVTNLAGARRSVGYEGEAYAHLLTDPIPGKRYDTHQHEVRYILRLAEAAGGIVAPEDARPRLDVQPAYASEMATTLGLARARLGAHGPVIAFHAGARNGQAKRWPTRQFAALAELLVRELDALVVVTGAPNEVPLARAITHYASVPILNLAGQTSLPQLAAILSESDVLVTGDSGPMHIACAVGTPAVVLHGPTDPALSGPTAPDAIVLRRRLWCSPCYDASATAECPYGNPVCMKDIPPRLVFSAVRRQLQSNRWTPSQVKRESGHVSATTYP